MSKVRSRVGVAALAVTIAALFLAGAAGGTAAAAQETVTVTVTVVDQGGNPLDGATVNASWDGGSDSSETRSSGEALLDVPEGADVTVEVDRTYYVRNRPLELESFDGEDFEISMAREGSATVVVEDENGPVANAAIRLFQDGQPFVVDRTDENGRYTTGPIEYDSYTLVAYKEGYSRSNQTLEVDGNVESTIGIEEDSKLVTFNVTDDHFDPPQGIEDATLTINGETVSDETVSTRGNGRVRYDLPVNDEYTVEISKEGYESVTQTVQVDEEPASLNASIRRIPAISVESAQSRVVVGEQVPVTVTDEYGQPVEGATISAGGEQVAETDAEGQATVPVDEAGELTIAASAGDLDSETTIEGIAADDETPTPTETATPTPTDTPTRTATATDASATTTSNDAPTTTGESGPGFGSLAALGALLALAVGAIRRP